MKWLRITILLLLELVLLVVTSPSPMHRTSSEIEIVEEHMATPVPGSSSEIVEEEPPKPIRGSNSEIVQEESRKPIPGSTSEIVEEEPIPTLPEPQVPGHIPPPEDRTTLIFIGPKGKPLSRVRPDQVQMEGRPWLTKLKSFKFKDEPPSLNYEMDELLKKRRHVLLYTLELRALTEYLPKVAGVEVVKLVGGSMDRDVMSVMTNRARSFFVIGGNGKVWFFESKLGGARFRWTDKISPALLELIRSVHGLPPSSNPLIREPRAAGDAADVWDRSFGQKMTAGSKGLFRKLSSALKSFHPS